ncbi:MAG: creatininase family protein [Cyanobacteria bacterium HKST-UBA02]|nr:creatininase family protein [Cyanobacteria bacterium HKST-UBA02]
MGIELENLTWKEAEKALAEHPVVVIPLGGSLKEHGLHLPLNNDWILAEYLKNEVSRRLPVLLAPTISHSYYPAMVDYPGTVSLSIETAAALIEEICTSLGRFGPRKFYILNTGISTQRPLERARERLSAAGIELAYTDLDSFLEPVAETFREQAGGSHADEIETSMMLHIAPDIVHLERAVPDFHGDAPGPLRRDLDQSQPGVYSPTGAFGDPTLATAWKGEKLLTALVQGILEDIRKLSLDP